MLSPGQRPWRVRFERRLPGAKSPSGNILEEWSALVTVWAGFRPRFGREQLASGHLESTMQGVLTVLAFAATRGVEPADRAVFVTGTYAGKKCQILSITPTPDGREIEMLLEHGGQT